MRAGIAQAEILGGGGKKNDFFTLLASKVQHSSFSGNINHKITN
jgi:hypothetical protein